ncbi:MAG: PIN domain-containing protein [Leptospiraceae bacterium]|nr:PIN domain-containing protein [Leptospiraceae bacterium]
MKLILDTHIFIYYMNGSKMPTRIKVAIENAKEVLLSTITSWEIFMLAKHGHITLSLPPIQWCDSAIAESGFKEIPISSKISNIA